MLRRLLKVTLTTLLLGYVGIGVLLYSFQDKLLYHPTPNTKIDYPQMVLHEKGADVVVHVLNEGHKNAILYFGGNAESMAQSADYIAQQFPSFTCYLMDYRGFGESAGVPSQNAILYFGGNAESMAQSADYIAQQFPAFTCYLMDYRGFGESTGVPSQSAIEADALALYDKVASKHTRISIGGRSLGTGVAAYVAAHRKVSKLALITPYDSIASVAQERYPFYPTRLLLKDTYNTLSLVSAIQAQTFIVIAENDKVIPFWHTQRLIDAFDAKKLRVETIKGRGHNDISDDERYYKIMQDFIGKG